MVIYRLTNIALGLEAEFKEISPDQYQQRLEAGGYPKHLALCLTHLCLTVGSGENYFESDGIIKARDVLIPMSVSYNPC